MPFFPGQFDVAQTQTMITCISIENYRSILNLKLDLSYAENQAPRGYQSNCVLPFLEIGKSRIVPSLALMGPNASGKTSILKALSAVAGFISRQATPFDPYRLKSPMLPRSEISVSWISNEKHYSYTVATTRDEVQLERLDCHGKPLLSVENGELSLFLKDHSGNIPESVLKAYRLECVLAGTNQQKKSVLPVLAENFPGLSCDLNEAYRYWTEKMVFCGLAKEHLSEGIDRLAQTFTDKDPGQREETALRLLSKYMQKLDCNIRGISLETKNLPTSPIAEAFGYVSKDFHQSIRQVKTYRLTENGALAPFPITMESQGTGRLLQILCCLLTAQRIGGVAIVDGLEESLHPAVVTELLKLFNERELNTRFAQIVFSTHDIELLANPALRMSQFGLVFSYGFNGTKVRRLVDFADIKPTDNFKKHYLNGYYHALPSAFI